MSRNYRHEHTTKIKLDDKPVVEVDLEALKDKLIASKTVSLAGAAGVARVDEAYVTADGAGIKYLHVGGLIQSLSTLSDVAAKIGKGFQDYIREEMSLDASASVVIEVEVSSTMVEVNKRSTKIHPPNSAIATMEGFKAEIEKRLSTLPRGEGNPELRFATLPIDMLDASMSGPRRHCLVMKWDTGRIEVYAPVRLAREEGDDEDDPVLAVKLVDGFILERNTHAAHELGIIDQLTLFRLQQIKTEQEREQRAAMLRRELEAIEGKRY